MPTQEMLDLYDSLDGLQPWKCKTCGAKGEVQCCYGCVDWMGMFAQHNKEGHEIIIGDFTDNPFRVLVPAGIVDGIKPTCPFPTDLDERLKWRKNRRFPEDNP